MEGQSDDTRLEQRPASELGINRGGEPVDPSDLADTIAALRAGYRPQFENPTAPTTRLPMTLEQIKEDQRRMRAARLSLPRVTSAVARAIQSTRPTATDYGAGFEALLDYAEQHGLLLAATTLPAKFDGPGREQSRAGRKVTRGAGSGGLGVRSIV